MQGLRSRPLPSHRTIGNVRWLGQQHGLPGVARVLRLVTTGRDSTAIGLAWARDLLGGGGLGWPPGEHIQDHTGGDEPLGEQLT